MNAARVRLLAAIIALLALGACAGSVVEFEGAVCGQQVRLKVVDNKDRSGFDATVTCGADGGVTVTTTDSSASAVMEAQAEALNDLAVVLAREAAAGVLP